MSRFERYLNENFLTAFKVMGRTEEVFVNPTSAEVREIMRASQSSVGVIMDIKSKQIYFFSRDNLIHSHAWKMFRPSGESRTLYQTDTLVTAEFDKDQMFWNFDSQDAFADERIIKSIQKKDWSYFKKWIPTIKKDIEVLEGQ